MNKIEYGMKLDFNQVLIRPKRTTLNSRSEVKLERTFKFKYCEEKWSGTPIIAANMDTIGTFDMYDVFSKHGIITAFHKFYTPEEFDEKKQYLDKNLYMISSGIKDSDFSRLERLYEMLEFKFLVVDVANGYIQTLVEFCQRVRTRFPNIVMAAGNVVTREVVEELILNGKVDIVKIGIGSGSACTTRLKTGVGMPQLSAIIECADAAHGVGGHIIGDGGITCPGDMSKAFGGGADFVMAGGIFSGHDENPGDFVEENGDKFKIFYGMSSKNAMETHYGKMDNYRASEGRYLKIKYKGSLENTILDYLGGLRSTCTYINANSIKDLAKCCTFVQVQNQLNVSLVM